MRSKGGEGFVSEIMKRYNWSGKVLRYEDAEKFTRITEVCPTPMTEVADGQWVRFEDVKAEIERLENLVPDIRIARLEKALNLVSAGCCPECGQKTDGYEFPFGSFAPEISATMVERGLDPFSNHKATCSRAGK